MTNLPTLDTNLVDCQILVVDDTPANLEVITDILLANDYNVLAVISGKRAIKQLQYNCPSLILLDIQMPGMDGFETCEFIKANPKTAHIPIIFLTAQSDPDSIVKGFALGAVDYITKPFREEELLARVQTHLKLRLLTEQLEDLVSHRTAELRLALEQVHRAKLLLIQQEKMSALGSLVAEVAHEVNNPVGFINGSIHTAKHYLQDFLDYLRLYQQCYPSTHPVLSQKAEEIELGYLLDDFPVMLNSMQMACDRIISITTNLRTFARTDTTKVPVNLNDSLDSSLLMLKYRLKANECRPGIDVVKQYHPLPPCVCFPNQINQVFMNILANAIDVFDEMVAQCSYDDLESSPQVITIQTQCLQQPTVIEIKIGNNGKGMTPEVAAKVFDYLFTTKGSGKGTGLGLAIAYQIVTETHTGEITVDSSPDKGTVFTIRLPY
ncbi:MAG: hybrid sensor histidine kinase/response regulator [Leptolyngbyaceae bacterium]|nr:hybrid sensor histidine kinase/response regulator [Leptolyngbyaceae bacterium]